MNTKQQEWEHLRVTWFGPLSKPEQIYFWPPEVVGLDWLLEDFKLDIRLHHSGEYIHIRKLIDSETAIKVSKAVMNYLGCQGWEAVSVLPPEVEGTSAILFRRLRIEGIR